MVLSLLPITSHAEKPTPVPSQAQDDLQQIYLDAMSAFNAGKYAVAAAGLEKIIAQAPPDAKLEPVYFTLGAAYFNTGQYDGAVTALSSYRTKFPNGARIAEATFSLGQAALLAKNYAVAAGAFKSLENIASYRQQALLLEGTTYKADGKTDDAVAVLERLYPDNRRLLADALLGSGRAFVGIDNHDKAREAFQQVVTDFAATPDASEAKAELRKLPPAKPSS